MATVEDIIDAAQQRTNAAIRDANTFVDRLANLASRNYNWNVGTAPLTNIQNYNSIYSNARTSHGLFIDSSRANATQTAMNSMFPGAVNASDIELESISEFNFQPETLNIPERPEFVRPQAPTGDVQIDEVNVSIGQAPTPVATTQHETPAIPDPDSIDIGSFLIPPPEVDYLTPTNDFSFVETEYSSDLKDAVAAALLDDMVNGGSGINPADEQALFERARDREAVTYRDNGSLVARQFAARGFKMPTGAMAGLLAKARDSFNAAMSGINRDIMLQRSQLHVQARQLAMQAGISLENAMMSFHSSVMERGMNVARFVAQFGIEYHNLEVRAFEDRLRQWVAHSQVRTQWVDNAIKKTKEYELKLAKLDLVDKRNARKTELMEAMNRAVSLADQIRRAELEIGRFQLENNKLRIEQSKLLTQNYSEIMRSNDAAARAYGEAIKAETLRNEPFRLRLEAHREERETAMAKVDMQQTRKNTEVSVYAANMKRYESQLSRYFKELDNAVNVAAEYGRMAGLDMEGWKTQLSAQVQNANLNVETQKAQAASRLDTYRAQLEAFRTDIDIISKTSDITRQASEAGINLYSSLIQGAQAALGTISVLTEEV